MTTSNQITAADKEAFILEVARHLGVESGVERADAMCWASCQVRGRSVEVGTNGSFYWVTVALDWIVPPPDSGIMWGPDGTYGRMKLLDEGPGPPKTGDDRFDATYLLVGEGANELCQRLSSAARAALLEHAGLHPEVSWFDLRALTQRLHIRGKPPVGADASLPRPRMGEALFAPARAAGTVSEAVKLAEKLERS